MRERGERSKVFEREKRWRFGFLPRGSGRRRVSTGWNRDGPRSSKSYLSGAWFGRRALGGFGNPFVGGAAWRSRSGRNCGWFPDHRGCAAWRSWKRKREACFWSGSERRRGLSLRSSSRWTAKKKGTSQPRCVGGRDARPGNFVVFLDNLVWSVSSFALCRFLDPLRGFVKASVIRKKRRRNFLAFGFAHFADASSAWGAVQWLDGRLFRDYILAANLAKFEPRSGVQVFKTGDMLDGVSPVVERRGGGIRGRHCRTLQSEKDRCREAENRDPSPPVCRSAARASLYSPERTPVVNHEGEVGTACGSNQDAGFVEDGNLCRRCKREVVGELGTDSLSRCGQILSYAEQAGVEESRSFVGSGAALQESQGVFYYPWSGWFWWSDWSNSSGSWVYGAWPVFYDWGCVGGTQLSGCDREGGAVAPLVWRRDGYESHCPSSDGGQAPQKSLASPVGKSCAMHMAGGEATGEEIKASKTSETKVAGDNCADSDPFGIGVLLQNGKSGVDANNGGFQDFERGSFSGAKVSDDFYNLNSDVEVATDQDLGKEIGLVAASGGSERTKLAVVGSEGDGRGDPSGFDISTDVGLDSLNCDFLFPERVAPKVRDWSGEGGLIEEEVRGAESVSSEDPSEPPGFEKQGCAVGEDEDLESYVIWEGPKSWRIDFERLEKDRLAKMGEKAYRAYQLRKADENAVNGVELAKAVNLQVRSEKGLKAQLKGKFLEQKEDVLGKKKGFFSGKKFNKSGAKLKKGKSKEFQGKVLKKRCLVRRSKGVC